MKKELCAKLHKMSKGRNKGQKMRRERSRRKENNAVSQNAREETSFNKYLLLSKYGMSGFRPDAGTQWWAQHNGSALRVHRLLRSVDKQHEGLQ